MHTACLGRGRLPHLGFCGSIIATMLLTTAPASAASQVALVGLAARASRACADTVTPQRFAKTTIVQREVLNDSIPAIADQLELVSQRIAEGVRIALGAAPNIVPENDTLADWRHVVGAVPVMVVFHRDAPTTWRVDSAVDPTRAKLLALYVGVLRGMSPNNLLVIWPTAFAPDSITLGLVLWPNEPIKLSDPPQFPVFSTSMGVVTATRSKPDHYGHVLYPVDAADHTVVASVTMAFMVDSSGHVDTASVTDVLPPTKSLHFPHAERYYREFVDAARKAVIESTFHPARWGGCPIPARVRTQFFFGDGPR